MPEENEYINDAGTGEDWENIDPEALDYYDDKNGGTGDEDPTPSEDDIFNDDLQNIVYNPPKPSEKWQKFQRVATVLGLASAIVTLIYFITRIASK